ncbi:MAG: SpoIIE family protein phosphatase [Bacteroidia bacterium]
MARIDNSRLLLFILASFLCFSGQGQQQAKDLYGIIKRADSLLNMDPSRAAALTNEAFGKLIPLKNDTLEYYCRFIRGIANYTLGNQNEALEDFIKNKQIAGRINSQTKLIESLNAIANVYKNTEQQALALKSYREALDAAQKTGNISKIYVIESNIAIVYHQMQLYDSSNYYSYKILRGLSKAEQNDYNFLANTIATLVNNYIYLRKKDSVAKYMDTVLVLKKRVGDMIGYAGHLYNLGDFYYKIKDYEKAEKMLKDALAVPQGNMSLTAQIKSQLGSVYFAEKKFAEAAREFGNAMNMQDSLAKAQAVETLSELEVKYETGKKESELLRLSLENERDALQLKNSKIGLMVSVIGILFCIIIGILMFRQIKSKQKANKLLEVQNHEILEQKKEITDSINYAKRIQTAILPPKRYTEKVLKQHFILYVPKDIVSGDFYWVDERNGMALFAAVDCTGHGVPGALMSVVGYNILSQAVKERGLTRPADILNYLDEGVHQTLRQSQNESGIKDGMDLAICCLHPDNTLECAGVYNSIWVVRKNIADTFKVTSGRMVFYGRDLLEIRPDKTPIGNNENDVADEFTNHTIQLQSGDYVYLYSDGFADQFGGERGKKFKYNKLKDELIAIHSLDPDAQREHLLNTFLTWKGPLEQVDDILVIGVKIA